MSILIGCYLTVYSLHDKQSIFINILYFSLIYFFAYIGIGLLLTEVLQKYKILSVIYDNILSIPFVGFMYFQYMLAPLLTLFMFLAIYFLPSMYILNIGETNLIVEEYKQGIIYITSLLSVIVFAYRSNIIMRYIIETFKPKLFKKYLERYTTVNFTRIYTYIFMIAIYISYNFLTFSNINLTFIPTEMLNVIKEVFVTFVSIDTLIQITVSQKNPQQ